MKRHRRPKWVEDLMKIKYDPEKAKAFNIQEAFEALWKIKKLREAEEAEERGEEGHAE